MLSVSSFSFLPLGFLNMSNIQSAQFLKVHICVFWRCRIKTDRLFHLSPQGKKGLCQDHLAPLVPQALRGHRASPASRVFQEAMLWGLQGLQDPLGHKDRQALKVQQVFKNKKKKNPT